MIVDINKAVEAANSKLETPQTAPVTSSSLTSSPLASNRKPLQHQSSLTASASAAVGEARKFLGSKLSHLPEANLRGAKDMVLAAASHLGGGVATGGQDSRVKFKNLRSDDNYEDDEDEDDESGSESFEDEDGATKNAAESTTVEEEDDAESSSNYDAKIPKSKTKRSQSILSSALSSYKQKQRGGYQKALNEDDDEEDEDDDGDDERMNLNRSVSFRQTKQSAGGHHQVDSTTGALDSTVSKSRLDSRGSSMKKKASNSSEADSKKRSGSARRHSRKSSKKKNTSTRKVLAKYEEDEDDLDTESGQRTFRCLDNSVALLIKSRFEETILRIAVGAILLVATGLFILLSLPPSQPPKEVVEILAGT